MTYLRKKTICFDLDGTLVHTAPDLVRVLNMVIAEEGLTETDYKSAAKSVGYGAMRLIEEAFARAGHQASKERKTELWHLFLAKYAESIADLSQPYPGVIETLQFLKRQGATLAVCTNKPGYLARPLLDALGMTHFFDRVVGGDETNKKPSPEHIWASAGHNKALDIAMIGDSYPDMRAAHNAKVASILVTYGYSQISPHKLKADVRIRNFRDLPSALDIVWSRL